MLVVTFGWLEYCGDGKAYGYVVGKGDVEIGGDKYEEDGGNDDGGGDVEIGGDKYEEDGVNDDGGGEGDEYDETDDDDEENGEGGDGVNKEKFVGHDDVKLYMLTVSFGG